MSYQAEFKGWDELTLADLLVAYRKAKADCFFEKGFPTAVKFAEYEQNLLKNLENLLEHLHRQSGLKTKSRKWLLNSCQLLPKKLGIEAKEGVKNGHIHFSSPERSFAYLCETSKLTAEFRIVGDFSVDIHIISALWINMIGHKFDACLDSNLVYGARLKRVNNDNKSNRKISKLFHITAIGSFQPYFKNYQQWRNNGLKAIRAELKQNRPVIAVSLDLKSYYHLLDSSFISSNEFQEQIGLKGKNKLTNQERDFTCQLSDLLVKWSNKANKFVQGIQNEDKISIDGGLTIGLTASRIISNVLLQKWDRLICERLTPIYYGRYVDDMFLVLHDPKNITDTLSFMKFLQSRLRDENGDDVLTNNDDSIWEINLGKSYQNKSKIQLQANKQKLFILEGQAGCDLLDSIEKEICDLSSEHRLMPAPEHLEHTTAARVLSAAGNIGEEADTLRHADGLTIRRLSWSLQLRHVETLAHDLPAQVWKKQRDEFYEFTYNHVLRAEKIFEQYQYLPRLLGLAISLKDWHQAELIIHKAFSAFDLLSNNTESTMVINGTPCDVKHDAVLIAIKKSLTLSFIDAVIRCYPVDLLCSDKSSNKLINIAKTLNKQDIDFQKKALLLASCDLTKTPYKNLFKILHEKSNDYSLELKKRELQIAHYFQETDLLNYDYLALFIKKSQYMRLNKNKDCKIEFERITPYLFPTRPYKSEEITSLVPNECVFGKNPLQKLVRYMEVLRGISINKQLLDDAIEDKETKPLDDTSKLPIITIGNEKSKTVTVAITNLATSNESLDASACNKPNLSVKRYQQLSDLINQAIKLKPNYLLLPELSLPLEWVDSVSNILQRCGINLIAGTEYRHIGENTVHSEACLTLRDDRFGYPSIVRIWQPKLQAAADEDKQLIHKFGKNWQDFPKEKELKEQKKPIYNHNGFCFGVMVCSELQNSKARIAFQGEVDALLVLAWNQDLETFSALVESAALDIHAYTVLVNNRNYGDSRVRVPAKESFARDLARLRGGENDFCVAVVLDIEKLRAFQSRAKRWTEKSDPFKPVPEGFKISKIRRYFPPK